MTKVALTQSRTVASRNETTSEGDVAASVFERFDRGTSPDEVVTELVLSVDTVEYLWRTWARLRGLVPLATLKSLQRPPIARGNFVETS